MEFMKLFIAALMPVLKVLIVTAVGSFIALDRFDILKEYARKPMNSMVYYVFAPALLCSNLTKTITLKSLVMLWFMPINMFLSFTIGTVFGWLAVKISRTPRHLKGLVLGCCSAGNVGNLPLIIVPAICKESNGAFGDVDVCFSKGMSYVSLAMGLGSIFLWGYTFNIVRLYTCEISNESKVDNSSAASVSATERDPEKLSNGSTGQLVNVEKKASQEYDQIGQLEIECPHEEAKVSKKEKIMKQMKMIAKKINLKSLFAPSTIGAIVGVILGVVVPFKKLFIGDNAPLRVVEDSAAMIGSPAIPVITLLIGANLLKGLKGAGVRISVIVGIIVVRFIAVPAVGVGIVRGAVRFGLIHPDPLYQFVLLLQFALPPAVTISTMTQLLGVGTGECSVIMLATYCFSAVALTLWCAFFMWLVL